MANYNRKSPRASFNDYSDGDYFITICTKDKIHYFGEIRDGVMIFSALGEKMAQDLEALSGKLHYCEVPLWVVMPNHIHAIICIDPNANYDGSSNLDVSSRKTEQHASSTFPVQRKILGVVVGLLKGGVTTYARRNGIDFAWQSRYHDHIIRGGKDGNNISEYIKTNVSRWAEDCFNENQE